MAYELSAEWKISLLTNENSINFHEDIVTALSAELAAVSAKFESLYGGPEGLNVRVNVAGGPTEL